MKILVCGGRTYGLRVQDTEEDQARAQTQALNLFKVLRAVHREHYVSTVVHGAAKGADSLAGFWARSEGIPEAQYPADWNAHGKRAGHIRNQQMLDRERPDLVIAFPGGTGTSDMVRRSKEQGFKVLDLRMTLLAPRA